MAFFDLTKKPAYFIFFITLVACFLVNSGSLSSSDALGRLQVTHWLWTNAPQVLPPNRDITGVGGKQFAQWGIGQSLLMLPGDMVSRLFVGHLNPGPFRSEAQTAIISYLTFPLLNAIADVLAFFLLQELGFSSTESVVGAIGLLFCTSFLPYAQVQQENSLMFVSVIGGFLGNILWLRTHRARHLCFGVCCLGFGLLVRLPCIFDAFAVALFTVLSIRLNNKTTQNASRKLLEYVLEFGLLYAPFILVDRLYQWLRFGSFTSNYFGILEAQERALDPGLPASPLFATPFFHGFAGFLVSPDKSIFLFNPLLLLTAGLLIRYRSMFDHGVARFICAGWLLLIIDICFYARATYWGGDTAWGPRYVITASQLIAFAGIPMFVRVYPVIKTSFEKFFYLCLIACSCVIQCIAVLFDDNLELAQEAAFHAKYVIIWQRAVNAFALSIGSFHSWGLDPGLAKSGQQKFAVLAFMPWRTAGEIPKSLTPILQTFWVIGCVALFAVVLVCMMRLRGKKAGVYGNQQDRGIGERGAPQQF